MDQEKLKVHKLFETMLYVYEDSSYVKPLIKATDKFIEEGKVFNKDRMKKRDNIYKKKVGDIGLSHASTSLIGNKKFEHFSKFVEQSAFRILESQGFDMSKQIIDYTDLWVQEFGKKGGGHQRVHIHNGHISGFYFLKCSNKTSYPIFHDPRPAAMITKLPYKLPLQTNSIQQVDFRPTPGKFMFFNSFLPHEFSVDPGVEPFRFIHFNLTCYPDKYF
jgi:uncharacterized protein (TIGR02466 family)